MPSVVEVEPRCAVSTSEVGIVRLLASDTGTQQGEDFCRRLDRATVAVLRGANFQPDRDFLPG